MTTPPRFAMPDGVPTLLTEPPQLASWDVGSHPGQVKLKAFLSATGQLLTPLPTGPLALRLDVGLAETVSWLDHHDLDNYLFPLAGYLSKNSGGDFVSFWATKAVAPTSSVRVEPALPAPGPLLHHLRTSAASDSVGYKQQIQDQLWYAAELPAGPLSLEVAFVVGPNRNWLNLWKPTIDALGPLLGATEGAKPWHPRDGRITRLGLHRAVGAKLRNDVLIGLAISR
jgi:hypothetical protein